MTNQPWGRYQQSDATPMPAWVESIRPTQLDAVEEITDCYASGADVVMLDAPTGAGKTLIAELVRRRLPLPTPNAKLSKTLYVCNTIGLQEQFLHDFSYARLVKGRSNYRPLDPPMFDYTCADCSGADCDWCVDVDGRRECPYEIAASNAESSRLAVTNTSYFIHAVNFANRLAGRDLVVADECDTLEGILTGFIEFKVSPKWLKRLGVNAPKKGSHFATVQEWVAGPFMTALKDYIGNKSKTGATVDQLREIREAANLYSSATRFLTTEGEWIRDNDAGPMVYKPITVGSWGANTLWKHGKKWLCMSGSIVSMHEQVMTLGAQELDVRLVTVPMSFPVANRPIIVAPVADMKYTNQDVAWPEMAYAIGKILELPQHAGQRVLVHCVSYKLAEYLAMNVDSGHRSKISYAVSGERDAAFDAYGATRDGVLFAPSMDRGFDFKEDLARVVIVAKVPFPSVGDKRISARLHEPGGQEWYNVQTVRTILQMTGRGVRSETDTCTTYILDSQFNTTLWGKAKTLFPRWWRDAIVRTFNPRQLKAPVERIVERKVEQVVAKVVDPV